MFFLLFDHHRPMLLLLENFGHVTLVPRDDVKKCVQHPAFG